MSEENNKLSWVVLRQSVAARTETDDKVVKVFMEALTACLTEALSEQENVRLNGLGTFRSQKVAERRSVHVRTGEAITIPAYNKISFTSEASVKQAINYAPSSLTPNEDPLRKLSEQADEIVGLLADMGQTIGDEKPEQVKEPEKPEVPEQEKEPEKQQVDDKPSENSKRPSRGWLYTGIAMGIACLMLVGAYFVLQQRLEAWIDTLREKTELTEVLDDEQIEEELTDVLTEQNEPEEPAVPSGIYAERDYSRLITTERITPGSRLAWIAWKYYGKKDLWVFLYEANRDRLTNPSDILIGTPIRVPELDERLKDTSLVETRQLIERLRIEYIGH